MSRKLVIMVTFLYGAATSNFSEQLVAPSTSAAPKVYNKVLLIVIFTKETKIGL